MDNGESSYRRFLDGDESGFDELVERYREPLINFINGFLHDLSESEDVAEDAFVELIVHPKRYSFRSSLKTYLFSVARNKAVDRIRYKKKYSFAPVDELDMADGTDIEDIIFRKENGVRVRAALDMINSEYSAVLRLLYIEGMSSDEAAKIMKKSKKQMANITYRAKQALRIALERGDFQYEK